MLYCECVNYHRLEVIVIIQYLVAISCDICAAHFMLQSSSMREIPGRQAIYKRLRPDGWQFGKYTLCPDCAKAHQEERQRRREQYRDRERIRYLVRYYRDNRITPPKWSKLHQYSSKYDLNLDELLIHPDDLPPDYQPTQRGVIPQHEQYEYDYREFMAKYQKPGNSDTDD